MQTLLYITDFYYHAKGREYFREDLYITEKFKDHFNILIGHPHQVLSYPDCADIIVFRNTGSVIYYENYFKEFVQAVKDKNLKTFNSFDGKADQQGKKYLLELFNYGYPVIPTVNSTEDLNKLGNHEKYIVKTMNGADSIGLEIVNSVDIYKTDLEKKIVQPFIDFQYEVSFYYINDQFQYALYAPDKTKRWELERYDIVSEDVEFADKFIKWNNIQQGITRVDACRQQDGSLLLVELEDLNPYLSLDLLDDLTKDKFISNWINALNKLYNMPT